ncbi:bacterio-opsin activator domain-containing protein [Natronobeatus ordinarius]|uniref:bacterio-opsin activator domain-containing protein n=1 Tax=Natronobeatus ordinarius TaxID=2963433 RepID=UPI0020CE256B|nr:bacterio-opsin activator domain-containing protein [Natronobeatus ordinarius]
MSVEETTPDILSRTQYEALLDAAATYREALVVRLAGEVGLRPAELSRLRPGDVRRVQVDPLRYLLTVPADETDAIDRTAYLPTRVERELRRYVRSNAIGDDDRIFPVTPRRLQMLVSEVADRAADLRTDPSLAAVSSSDLRRFFAYTALVEHDVNPRVVKAVGGWHSFEGLEPYLPAPTEGTIVDAFEPVERPETAPAEPTEVDDDTVIRSLLTATERCALVRLDEEGYVDRWNRGAAATFGYRAGEILGTHVSTFYTDEDVERGVPERTLRAAAAGSGVEDDGWRVRNDGSTFFASEHIAPVRDEDGRHRGFAVLVFDVTEFYEHLESTQPTSDESAGVSLVDLHRDVTNALLEASTHEEIETDVSTTLAEGDAYSFAWIDRRTLSSRHLEWRAVGGLEPDDVDALASSLDTAEHDESSDEPATASSVDRDVSVDLPNGGRFAGAVATVPIVSGETVYGTLRIGSTRPDAFDDVEREWLETIGRQVGHAIAAVRRRNLLLSDTVVELEFVCTDDRSFFVDATDRLACRFELDSLVPISESKHLYYVRLGGASPGDVFELAEDDPGIEDARLIESYEAGYRVEFVVDGSSPTLTLTEYGATVLETIVEGGEATIVAECAADADLRTIVDGLRSQFPGSELVGKREVERSVQTAREFRAGLEERLTDRQEAALRAAYFGGYYDWPRESTAEEIADAMDISSPTLHNHLRKAQHELLRTFFDESSVDDAARGGE